MNFFIFTRADYERLVKECMLNEEYQKLLEYKILGYSIIQIAQKLNCSEARVSVMVRELKKKIKKII